MSASAAFPRLRRKKFSSKLLRVPPGAYSTRDELFQRLAINKLTHQKRVVVAAEQFHELFWLMRRRQQPLRVPEREILVVPAMQEEQGRVDAIDLAERVVLIAH